jgi:hypothetical protein
MLTIKNYYVFNEYKYYDPSSNLIVPFRRGEVNFPSVDDSFCFNGYYSEISKKEIVFFRENATLFLLIDFQKFIFDHFSIHSYTQKRSLVNHQVHLVRHITIKSHEMIIFDDDYDEIVPTFEMDMTPFAEDEDFDFGLFLENVSKDKSRQSRLFTTSSDKERAMNFEEKLAIYMKLIREFCDGVISAPEFTEQYCVFWCKNADYENQELSKIQQNDPQYEADKDLPPLEREHRFVRRVIESLPKAEQEIESVINRVYTASDCYWEDIPDEELNPPIVINARMLLEEVQGMRKEIEDILAENEH